MTQFMQLLKRSLRHMQQIKNLEILSKVKDTQNLGVHPSGEAFKTLPIELKKGIPNYIKENVDLERLANVG